MTQWNQRSKGAAKEGSGWNFQDPDFSMEEQPTKNNDKINKATEVTKVIPTKDLWSEIQYQEEEKEREELERIKGNLTERSKEGKSFKANQNQHGESTR